MLVQESLLGETLHSKNMLDTTDEADETLSLCDLPLYSDQSVEEWQQDLSSQSQGSTSISSSDDQDYFEFFSHELSSSTTNFSPENIIFCGKLIPYKQPDTSEQNVSSKAVESNKQTSIKKKRGWGIFGWKFGSSRSSNKQILSKNGKKGTALVQKKDHNQSSPKKKYNSNKHGKGYDFPVHKMSILTSSSSGKARWYLLLFGISRLSSEVELKDIKSRQSRRHHLPPPPPVVRFHNYHEEKVSGGADRGSSGLWGLIRVLSCGGNHHPNAMVVGSLSCNRLD